MSWKTAGAVVGIVAVAVAGWTTFSASVVLSADLTDHNKNAEAHRTHPAHAAPVDPVKKAEVVAMIAPIETKVAENETAMIEVRDGFYDQRAEDLAWRAVDNLPESTPPRRRVRRFEEVRSRARKNLAQKLPIRTGLSIAP